MSIIGYFKMSIDELRRESDRALEQLVQHIASQKPPHPPLEGCGICNGLAAKVDAIEAVIDEKTKELVEKNKGKEG